MDIIVSYILWYIFMGEYCLECAHFLFPITKIWCLGHHKRVGKWLYLHKYEEFPQYLSPIL